MMAPKEQRKKLYFPFNVDKGASNTVCYSRRTKTRKKIAHVLFTEKKQKKHQCIIQIYTSI